MKVIGALLVFVALSSAAEVSNYTRLLRVCKRGLPLVHRDMELQCCEMNVEAFRAHWSNGAFYLSRYLDILKTWRCPHLQRECEHRPYDYTKFTDLTYDRFCNGTELQRKCINDLRRVMGRQKRDVTTPLHQNASSEWRNLVKHLDVSIMEKKNILEPCVQVAQMDTEYGGFGDFHEMVNMYIPFCSPVWSGFSRPVVDKKNIVPWDVMSQTCRANIIVIMIAMGCLALLVVVANVTVIVVFTTTPKLQNSQAVYKISLAIADLLVGVVVLPTFATSLSKMVMQRQLMGSLEPYKYPNISIPFIDWDRAPLPGRDGYHHPKTTGNSFDYLDETYVNAVGCVTTTSLVTSLYTLMLAGFDRSLAVFRPLHYRRHSAKKIAIRFCAALWIVATILSLLPLVTEFQYAIIASVLIASSGTYALVVYLIAFLIPLVVVWVTNISIYIYVRKQTRKRMNMTTRNIGNHSGSDSETRLTVTLSIIVGVFTLSALPATVTTLVAFFIPTLDMSRPKTFSPGAHTAFNSAEFICIVVLMCNSLWNCFIYSARNKDFKRAMHELVHKLRKSLKLVRERRSESKLKSRRSRRYTRRMSTTLTTSTTKSTGTNGTSGQTRTVSFINPSPPMEERNVKAPHSVTDGSSAFQSFNRSLKMGRFFHSVMKRVDTVLKDGEYTVTDKGQKDGSDPINNNIVEVGATFRCETGVDDNKTGHYITEAIPGTARP